MFANQSHSIPEMCAALGISRDVVSVRQRDQTARIIVQISPSAWLIRILAAERCDRMKDEPSTIGIDLEGRIHHARGTAVAACHLAKLLRHHRLRCGDADGLDVRGDYLDRGEAGASVVAE